MEDLLDRYNRLIELCSERKEKIKVFLEKLESTSWLTAPASTRFHLNEERGLLRHSVGVAETLLRMRESLAPEITEESCVIVGLFHDLGKIGTFEKPFYVKAANSYRVNKEIPYMGVPQRSIYLLAPHIPLTDQEAQAILYHDGQYVAGNREVAHRESLLTLLVTFADTWQCARYEEERK